MQFRASAFNWLNHPLPGYASLTPLTLNYLVDYSSKGIQSNYNTSTFGVMDSKTGPPYQRILDGLDYNWGRAAFAGSQFADAIMPLSRYVQSHPDDTGARSVLAISQFMVGNYLGCIEALKPAIESPNLSPQAEYVYAASQVKTQQTVPGTDRLLTLERAHPQIPEVHRTLGEALAQQGFVERAREELRTSIKLDPADADSHYDMGKLELGAGDTTAAIPELETAARLSPRNTTFHRSLADAYTTAHRSGEAQRERDTWNSIQTQTQRSDSPHPDH